jgi:hypothetical protein
MPLIHSKSPKAFEKNLKTEMSAGKPQKQALAIAYSLKRRAPKKMAHGGPVELSAKLESRPEPEYTYASTAEEARNKLRKGLRDAGWLDNPSVHELEHSRSVSEGEPERSNFHSDDMTNIDEAHDSTEFDMEKERSTDPEHINADHDEDIADAKHMAEGGFPTDAEAALAQYKKPSTHKIDEEYLIEHTGPKTAHVRHKGKIIDTVHPDDARRVIEEHRRSLKMAEGGYIGEQQVESDSERAERKPEHTKNMLYAEGGETDDIDKWISRQGSKKPRGVHTEIMPSDPGTSDAGSYLKGYGHNVETAKELHRRKLEEMRSMPKPNLYASGGPVERDFVSEGESTIDNARTPEEFDMEIEASTDPEHINADHDEDIQDAKHMAEGGRAELEDDTHETDTMTSPDLLEEDRRRLHMAEGGEAESQMDEDNEGIHQDLADEVLARRHLARRAAQNDDQANLASNAREWDNENDELDYDALKKENYSEAKAIDFEQPRESNEDSPRHEPMDIDDRDIVAAARRRIKKQVR